MSDVLNQNDIDSLLSALDSGELVEENDRPSIFSRRRKRDLDLIEIKPYDFKRPERVSKDQMQALQQLHENFARNFGAGLSGFLRMIVEVHIANCEQMTYGEFIAGLPNPTSFNLINVDQLEGQVCLELSPLIIYPIIDRLLGGNNRDLFIPQRPLTMIEQRLIGQVIVRAMNALTEAWESVRELTFTAGDSESNPHLVQIVPPNEVVVVVTFELKMANRAGAVNLCIPFKVIEPIMGELNAQQWFSSDRTHPSGALGERIAENLSRASVTVTGVLAETTMTVQDLLSLSVGDLVTTEKPANQPAVLMVESEKKFVCNLGQIDGARALKVAKPYGYEDRL
jgi:flagellar motor switch protein FliM